jgi:hypothetical protein
MENLLPKAILLFLTGVVLYYASWYDIRNHKIESRVLGIMLILGALFFVANQTDILLLLTIELIITFIFLIPTFFGMGWGDMFLLWTLGLFFTSENDVRVFFIGFLVFAVIWTLVYIDKYRLWKDKKSILKLEFPFVPPISVGFFIYIVFSLF